MAAAPIRAGAAVWIGAKLSELLLEALSESFELSLLLLLPPAPPPLLLSVSRGTVSKQKIRHQQDSKALP